MDHRFQQDGPLFTSQLLSKPKWGRLLGAPVTRIWDVDRFTAGSGGGVEPHLLLYGPTRGVVVEKELNGRFHSTR
eukprot:3758705-Amphidinium_carterae.1